MQEWYVYILRSLKDGSLYTGISLNVDKRLKKHNDGRGARYTKSRRPLVLVFQEKCKTRSEALKIEYAIKQLSKADKEIIVTTQDRTSVNICLNR